MIDIEKLKALALAATPTPWTDAALKLIAEVERLTCELQNQREIAQHWKASAGYISAPAAGTVEKDAARLDWLNQNFFSDQKDEWDERQSPNSIKWKFFGPMSIQGDVRRVIDAAIEAHNKAGKEQG